MSRLKIIMVTFVVIVLFVVFFIFVKIQDTKDVYEKRITNYLLDEGYEKKEIKSIEVIYGFKMPAFYTVVVFEDEPYVKYIYYSHNGVKQIEYTFTDEGNKKGIDETKLKHYVRFDYIDKYK